MRSRCQKLKARKTAGKEELLLGELLRGLFEKKMRLKNYCHFGFFDVFSQKLRAKKFALTKFKIEYSSGQFHQA